METPKAEYTPFRVGQDIIVNGAEMKIVGTDLAGNPIVESKMSQPISHPETLKTKDWTRAEAGLGSVSVKSTPLYCR